MPKAMTAVVMPGNTSHLSLIVKILRWEFQASFSLDSVILSCYDISVGIENISTIFSMLLDYTGSDYVQIVSGR
jgi:hypothetical protein